MESGKSVLRGAAAGMVGGFVASWVMNRVASIAEPAIEKQTANHGGEAPHEPLAQEDHGELADATMKDTAVIIAGSTGHRLNHHDSKRNSPVIHYAFGSLVGAIYGGLAECVPQIGAGAGTSFGTALLAGADLCAVPALGLGLGSNRQPAFKSASPFVAHLVYGLTTDLVRRVLR